MADLFKNLGYLNKRLSSTAGPEIKAPEVKEAKEVTASEETTVLSVDEYNRVVEVLENIIPVEYESGRELAEHIARSLRYASYDSVGKVPRPSEEFVAEATQSFLKKQGYKIEAKNALRFVASSKDSKMSFEPRDMALAKSVYEQTLRFRKSAAILPDLKFVEGLAKKAFNTLLKVKPKDPSKCLAGIIHTMFFDYAMDKNIYLTSSFYHELRNKYMPAIKANFGIDEIKYYAANAHDKALVAKIEEAIANPKSHLALYKEAKSIYPELSERPLCERILYLSELLGYEDPKVKRLAASLSKETKLEFKFAAY